MVGLVLQQAARLVGAGMAAGLVAAALLARLISSLLYGVRPFDAATVAAVSLLLAIVALMASYLPAQRAAKADPLNSLRCE